MAKSRGRASAPPKEPVALAVPRAEAAAKVQAQINAGEALLNTPVVDEKDRKNLETKTDIWRRYNRQLLKNLFTTTEIEEEYYSHWYGGSYSMRPTLDQEIGYVRRDIENSLTSLRSIHGRLELFREPDSAAAASPLQEATAQEPGNAIFIVHGQNDGAKQTVARFLERLGLAVVVLHEQPDRGRTIIEKFEQHSNVRHAVVLLTGDDVGGSRTARSEELRPRARQNVILELGYFIGTLGRTHVSTLVEDGVELPSDFSGVLYIPLDAGGSWKLRLASEMKSASIPVDLNKVL